MALIRHSSNGPWDGMPRRCSPCGASRTRNESGAQQGTDSPETLSARVTHAECLHAAGRYGESEDAWRELAEVKTRVLGAADPGTLDVRERHAIAMYELGEFAAAAAEFDEVAAFRERTLGADHADTRRAREWHQAALAELEHP